MAVKKEQKQDGYGWKIRQRLPSAEMNEYMLMKDSNSTRASKAKTGTSLLN